MIKEDYVSFETAKLLKEKGFNEPCRKIYFTNGDLTDADASYLCEITNSCMPGFRQNGLCTSPTQQMVMKWLREVHGLFIRITEDITGSVFEWSIYQKNYGCRMSTCVEDSYEQACEAAIKHCLEHLT